MPLSLRGALERAQNKESKERVRFSIYVDPVIMNVLREKADLEGRSVNNYVIRVLAKHALVDAQK